MDCPCFTSGTRIALSLASSPSVARIPLRDSDIFSVACLWASNASYTVLVSVHFFTSLHPLHTYGGLKRWVHISRYRIKFLLFFLNLVWCRSKDTDTLFPFLNVPVKIFLPSLESGH